MRGPIAQAGRILWTYLKECRGIRPSAPQEARPDLPLQSRLRSQHRPDHAAAVAPLENTSALKGSFEEVTCLGSRFVRMVHSYLLRLRARPVDVFAGIASSALRQTIGFLGAVRASQSHCLGVAIKAKDKG